MGTSKPDVVTASDYGASVHDLETLRRLIATQCPMVRFGGHTRSGARVGEYSFRLPPGPAKSRSRSAWVQAPVTPNGNPRHRLGLWCYRLTRRRGEAPRPWIFGSRVETVADWVCTAAAAMLAGAD